MISIMANGKPCEMDAPVSVAQFLREASVNPETVAVMLNGNVLRREDFPHVSIEGGATLEVVRMVGGG